MIRTSRIFGGFGRESIFSLLQILRQQKEIHLASDHISRPTYVVDFAKAIISLLREDISGIYHYANQGAISKYEFTKLIWEKAKQKKIPMACTAFLPKTNSERQSSINSLP
ncbi:MAG: sugar nucleotide-binding protein, partial [Chlamydiales bacterium]|nr:sugar nucleotide-binding protein [Chlamydiales bacterium]